MEFNGLHTDEEIAEAVEWNSKAQLELPISDANAPNASPESSPTNSTESEPT